MIQEYFEELKEDLLRTYADELCEESVADIKAADTLGAFIDVLNKYTALLKYKCIPRIDWVRKWFGGYKNEVADYGCYIDMTRTVLNPSRPITLYGNANISLITFKPGLYKATTQDTSHLSIISYGTCAINVRQKNESNVSILNKSDLSTVKIRKV